MYISIVLMIIVVVIATAAAAAARITPRLKGLRLSYTHVPSAGFQCMRVV